MCFTMRNGLQAKFGPIIEVVFSKNGTPLERKGRFINLEELGTGSTSMESLVSSGTERQKTT